MSPLASFVFGLATGGFHVAGGAASLVMESPYDHFGAFTTSALTTYFLIEAPFPDLGYAMGYALAVGGVLHYLDRFVGAPVASPPSNRLVGLGNVAVIAATPFLGACVYLYATGR